MAHSQAVVSTPSVHWVTRMIQSWNRFWFTPGDPTTLGLVRLMGGFVILYVHLAYSYDLEAFFGPRAYLNDEIMTMFRLEAPITSQAAQWEDSVFFDPPTPDEEVFMKKWGSHPRNVIARGRPIFSLWFHLHDIQQIWVAHTCILLIMFCFAIGFCTRVTSVLTWISMLFYIHRANTSLFGMDTIMIVVVMYMAIGPSGAAFSVDRLIARYLAERRARREKRPMSDLAMPVPSISANLAIKLLQVHASIIYLVSGLTKLQGGAWWAGTATWGTMANFEFSPMRSKLYMMFLQGISDHRWLWETVMMVGTYGTLLFEIAFIFLVWNKKFRWLLITAAALFHFGVAIFMGLVTFSMMMMVLVLGFVPPETIHQLTGRFRRRLPQGNLMRMAG